MDLTAMRDETIFPHYKSKRDSRIEISSKCRIIHFSASRQLCPHFFVFLQMHVQYECICMYYECMCVSIYEYLQYMYDKVTVIYSPELLWRLE